jgi:hypothetical protein
VATEIVGLRVPPEVMGPLRARAKRERRPVASMAVLLIEGALQIGLKVPVEPSDEADDPNVQVPVPAESLPTTTATSPPQTQSANPSPQPVTSSWQGGPKPKPATPAEKREKNRIYMAQLRARKKAEGSN